MLMLIAAAARPDRRGTRTFHLAVSDELGRE